MGFGEQSHLTCFCKLKSLEFDYKGYLFAVLFCDSRRFFSLAFFLEGEYVDKVTLGKHNVRFGLRI